MTFLIRVPAGTNRYSLVTDLQTMANDTSSHLDVLDTKIAQCVVGGSSPSFGTITTTSAPTFPAITVTGQRPTASIKNDANGFGPNASALKFVTTDDTTWTSSGHINVPNGGTGTSAINRNALTTEVATLNATITALTTRVTALEANRATTSYVDTKIAAANASISSSSASITSLSQQMGTKANHTGDLATVQNANYAGSAGSAGSAANANNTNLFRGRALAVGAFYAGTLSGGQASQTVVTHNLGYTPVVLAMAYGDTGVQSIVCSIEGIDNTNAVIKYRNLNSSASESFSVNWMAI